MTKNQEIQRLYKLYKDETHSEAVDMHEFATWLEGRGYEMPVPANPLELLAKQCVAALREETRRDPSTGQPYKVNLSFSPDGSGQGTLWVDVDEAPRRVVVKCLTQRRDQMVGDAYQITLIQDHWNAMHPDEEPIQMQMDFFPDVEWKKNGGDAQDPTA